MKQDCPINACVDLLRRGEDAPALPGSYEHLPVGRRHPCRAGAILFEALLALIILTLGIFAFYSLFTANTTRMAKAQKDRGAALFADSVLNTLRAVSDEQARQGNWLGFWKMFLDGTTQATVLATAYPDAWTTQAVITGGFCMTNGVTPNWETSNAWAMNYGVLAFGADHQGTTLTAGTVRTVRSGWYCRQLGIEASSDELFGANERYPSTSALTRRSAICYQISACFMANGIGETNRVAILVHAWPPGTSGETNTAKRVGMYAEFWDTGTL